MPKPPKTPRQKRKPPRNPNRLSRVALLQDCVTFAGAFDLPESAALTLFEFFSNIVVRRGTAPAAPGSLLPMQVPQAEG